MSNTQKVSFYSFFIWLLAIFFYFYEFFLRVLPATIAKNIIETLSLSLEQFAIIGSAYYFIYSFMQIPVGLLLDRFSPRLLVTTAAGMCAIGSFFLSFAGGFTAAFIARLMIGFGSSFGFVGLMIVTLNWFPRKYFAFLIGCGQALGAIGPLCAGTPIALMMKAFHNDWRIIFFWVASFGVLLTVLIGIFIRGKPTNTDTIVFVDKVAPLSKRLKTLLSQAQIWWILVYSAMIYVSLPLLGAFWGTSYLEARGFTKPIAAFLISMIWVGLAVGSPVVGKLSDQLKKRKSFLALSAALGIISSLTFLITKTQNETFLAFVFFLVGFSAAGQSLAFAVVTENAPKALRATALGINNTAIMGFSAIVPPLVTIIIQHYGKGQPLTEAAFEKGLLVIPLVFIVALLVSLIGIRETFCRQQNEVHFVKNN